MFGTLTNRKMKEFEVEVNVVMRLKQGTGRGGNMKKKKKTFQQTHNSAFLIN